jgi:excisionase family DNA binding protein
MQKTAHPSPEQMLTPGEVASRFRVDPKTVSRWATAGRLACIRTPGGHRRFPLREVEAFFAALHQQRRVQ